MSGLSKTSWITIERALLGVYVLLLCGLLLAPPAIGLANNGDFGKTVGFFSLGSSFDNEYKYADLKHHFAPLYHSDPPFRSSETLLDAVAIGPSRLFSKSAFDMRWIGMVHGAVTVLALYLLLPLLRELPKGRRLILAAVLLGVFADVMYVSYFSSFYMDAATYVFLVLAAVLLLRAARSPSRALAISLISCVVLLITSKPQHAVFGLPLAILFAVTGARLWPGTGRYFAAISAALCIAAAVFALKSSPAEYAADGSYTVIFLQVLPHSTDIAGDLREMGLDDADRQWIGTYALADQSGMNNAAFAARFRERMPYAKLGEYFLTHPRTAYLALRASADEGARQRPGLGNYDPSSGRAPYAESHAFSLWSDAKKKLFYHRPELYLAYYSLVVICLCATATIRKNRLPSPVTAGAYTLACMGLIALLTASLADAAEIARHHFIASAILDMMLVGFLTLLCLPPAKSWRPPSGPSPA